MGSRSAACRLTHDSQSRGREVEARPCSILVGVLYYLYDLSGHKDSLGPRANVAQRRTGRSRQSTSRNRGGLLRRPRNKTRASSIARRSDARSRCVAGGYNGAPGHVIVICGLDLRSPRMTSLIDCPAAYKLVSSRSYTFILRSLIRFNLRSHSPAQVSIDFESATTA
jgi:hypothetical protein